MKANIDTAQNVTPVIVSDFIHDASGQMVLSQYLVEKLADSFDPPTGKDIYLEMLAQEVLRLRKMVESFT